MQEVYKKVASWWPWRTKNTYQSECIGDYNYEQIARLDNGRYYLTLKAGNY